MNFFNHDEAKDAHHEISNYSGPVDEHHKAKFSHEFIAGAAGFGAMTAYEHHQRKNGDRVKFPLAKGLLAGFAAAEVDKLVESKGKSFSPSHIENCWTRCLYVQQVLIILTRRKLSITRHSRQNCLQSSSLAGRTGIITIIERRAARPADLQR